MIRQIALLVWIFATITGVIDILKFILNKINKIKL